MKRLSVLPMILLLATALVAQGPTPHNVTLTWAASVTQGVTYKVYRATVSGGPYTSIGTTATLSFTDASGAGGQKYFYVVTSALGSAESGPSNEVTATFLVNPAAPTGLTAASN